MPPPQIVNPDPRYAKVSLIDPAPLGYIHLAATVHPRPVPFFPDDKDKLRLLDTVKDLGRRLEQVAEVVSVSVFKAVAIAPPTPYVRGHPSVHRARFDVVVLVETTSPQTAAAVRDTAEYRAVEEAVRAAASDVHVFTARNARRVADVDKRRPGLFIFNYFVGDDPDTVVQLWDYLAGWYEVETGLDNSTLLAPADGETSDFAAINNARWDQSLARFLWRQFSKKSFRNYMVANINANNAGSMPALYRLA